MTDAASPDNHGVSMRPRPTDPAASAVPREPIAAFSSPRAIFYPWTRYPWVEILVGCIDLAAALFFIYVTLYVAPRPFVPGAILAGVLFVPQAIFFFYAGIKRWRWKATYIRLTGTKPW